MSALLFGGSIKMHAPDSGGGERGVGPARKRAPRRRQGVGHAEQAYELSESAAALWRAIDGQRTIAELAAVFAQDYRVDRQTAAVDVSEVLTVLADNGIVDFSVR